jgi:hypothetical protein
MEVQKLVVEPGEGRSVWLGGMGVQGLWNGNPRGVRRR